jgi:hypothetical protein
MSIRTAILVIASAFVGGASWCAEPLGCEPAAGRWQAQVGAFEVLFEVSSDASRVIAPQVFVYPLECDSRYPSSVWHWGTPAAIAPANCTSTFVGICDQYGAGAELAIRFVTPTEARVDFEYRNETALCAPCVVFQDLSVQPAVAVEPHTWARVKILYRDATR